MTLTEYLNQGDNVKRQHNVGLEFDEVTIYKVGLHYRVQVPKLDERFKSIGFNATYYVERNGRALWAIDEQGQKKSMSCFHLNFDPSSLTSESPFHPLTNNQ